VNLKPDHNMVWQSTAARAPSVSSEIERAIKFFISPPGPCTTVQYPRNQRSARGCTEHRSERFLVRLLAGIRRIGQEDIKAHEAITLMARASEGMCPFYCGAPSLGPGARWGALPGSLTSDGNRLCSTPPLVADVLRTAIGKA